jgi:hypothetical protein
MVVGTGDTAWGRPCFRLLVVVWWRRSRFFRSRAALDAGRGEAEQPRGRRVEPASVVVVGLALHGDAKRQIYNAYLCSA